MHHNRVLVNRGHYVDSFREYAKELSKSPTETDGLRLRKMERDLFKMGLNLGLNPVEMKRIAVRCGLEIDLATRIAVEFARKSI